MKTILKIFSSVLLIFNGIGAVYGGGAFILQPDGSLLGMSLEFLKTSPFTSYLIPGIILFLCMGIFSFYVLYKVLRNSPNYSLYIMAEGMLLCGWIAIQILMIKMVIPLHWIMGGTGVLLVIAGIVSFVLSKRRD